MAPGSRVLSGLPREDPGFAAGSLLYMDVLGPE
jgi:hypothetical protein